MSKKFSLSAIITEVSISLGILLGIYLTIIKFGFGEKIGDRPLLILALLLFLTGVQLFSLGILAEIIMRTYHESQQKPIYRVREVIERNTYE